jgi:gluconolactonase
MLVLTACSGPNFPTTGSVQKLDSKLDRIIAPGTLPEILAEGFEWSEGPLWLPAQGKGHFFGHPQQLHFRMV